MHDLTKMLRDRWKYGESSVWDFADKIIREWLQEKGYQIWDSKFVKDDACPNDIYKILGLTQEDTKEQKVKEIMDKFDALIELIKKS